MNKGIEIVSTTSTELTNEQVQGLYVYLRDLSNNPQLALTWAMRITTDIENRAAEEKAEEAVKEALGIDS